MIIPFKKIHPAIHQSCFVASNATVIGNVVMKKGSSVWFGTVVRADNDQIMIGEQSNIQDNCTLHTDVNHQIHIGKRVTVGHNVIIHGSVIEDEVLIGMGAVILNGAHVGKHSIIGANALILENQIIPTNSVVVGNPARVIKKISDEQLMHILENAVHYEQLGNEYKHIEETSNGQICK